MSRYRFISGFRVMELLLVISLITVLTGFAFQEYKDHIRNAFAGNFMMLIQSAKTDALIDAAFYGIGPNSEHQIIYSKESSEDLFPFESLYIDNQGKVTLITPDKLLNDWQAQEMKGDFLEKEISMYIHRTGTQAYGFNFLSCDPTPQSAVSDTLLSGVKKLDRTYYQYHCQ